MELEWVKSEMFSDTYYCNPDGGKGSPGNLQLKGRVWVWSHYSHRAIDSPGCVEYPLSEDFDEAKIAVEAMIRLEG